MIANSTNEPRVSVAVFFNPGSKEDMNLYGPLYELISNEKPACYRNFNMSELVNIFLAKAVGCKSITEHFKHKWSNDNNYMVRLMPFFRFYYSYLDDNMYAKHK